MPSKNLLINQEWLDIAVVNAIAVGLRIPSILLHFESTTSFSCQDESAKHAGFRLLPAAARCGVVRESFAVVRARRESNAEGRSAPDPDPESMSKMVLTSMFYQRHTPSPDCREL